MTEDCHAHTEEEEVATARSSNTKLGEVYCVLVAKATRTEGSCCRFALGGWEYVLACWEEGRGLVFR